MLRKKRKRERKEGKRGIAMTFEWIFAMLIGGIIIFIAIYAVVHFMTTGQQTSNTQVAAKLEGYLSPYETGQGAGISDQIQFPVQSKLLFEECNSGNNKPFGVQTFAYNQQMWGKYGKESIPIEIKSKYIFANESVEGKNFYIVSVPFFTGYKVSDIILIYSGKYCFYQAPDEIKDNVGSLQLENINLSDDNSCKGIKVCFNNNQNDCDIQVSGECQENGCNSVYDYGKVEKFDKNRKLVSTDYYMGNLMYGAIFSSDKIYECNVKRLMSKFSELGKVYLDKIKITEPKGCSSNIQISLASAMSNANGLVDSGGLIGLYSQTKDMEKINEATSEGCRLFVNE